MMGLFLPLPRHTTSKPIVRAKLYNILHAPGSSPEAAVYTQPAFFASRCSNTPTVTSVSTFNMMTCLLCWIQFQATLDPISVSPVASTTASRQSSLVRSSASSVTRTLHAWSASAASPN